MLQLPSNHNAEQTRAWKCGGRQELSRLFKVIS